MTQLYLISPEKIELEIFKPKLEEALADGHVSVFQLRQKNLPENEIIESAKALMPICHKHNVQFILNDNARIAAKVGADGVHVGEEKDGTYDEARKLLGNKVVGVSCYGSIERAIDFAEKGADYVAFGAFYPTTTKTPKARPEPEILEWWVRNSVVPCVAIGGITAENSTPIVKSGADFIAVVSFVWGHPKGVKTAIKELAESINNLDQ
ncbi:MAG: thiE [Rickettsiaceae bacterium]|jgi:thiamine-phosphate pyrophosphorylase|nr:thiE [Rickettsiaceae bacterium]